MKPYASLKILCFALASLSGIDPARAADRSSVSADGTPTVQYDLADFVPEGSSQAIFLTGTPTFQLPLVLSEPTGGFGKVTWMAYEMTASMGSVFFKGGQTHSGYALTFAAEPTFDLVPGWLLGKGLSYLILPQNLEVGDPYAVTPVYAKETGGRSSDEDCWVYFCCVVTEYALPDGEPGACEFGNPGSRGGGTLIRYRDEILTATEEGQYYIDLYYQHSLDMIRATVADPSLLLHVAGAQGAWLTALQALVDGAGGGVTVTQQMADDLNAVLDSFAAHGSPDLVDVVTTERQKLELDSIVGLTLNEFQEQIETLGGPTAIEPRSWGGIKSLYR